MDKSKKSKFVILIVTIAICLVAYGAYYAGQYRALGADAGVSVETYEGMTDEEIQAALDRQTEESRMTLSVSPTPELKDGRARVNVINVEDNKFAQTFTLTQNGKNVYVSGLIKPGQKVEWCDAKGAKPGEASIVIQAHDAETGEAVGNPQSVTVELSE